MTKTELEDAIWTICQRVGIMSGEVYSLRYGTQQEPQSLPYKLIMFINQNFNNLYEVNSFFAPMNKQKNKQKFLGMLSKIAPFKSTDILFEGTIFSIKNKIYNVVEINYEDKK